MSDSQESGLLPTGEILTTATVLQGALLGAVAYVLGFVLTYALIAVDGELGPDNFSGGDSAGTEIGFAAFDPSAIEFAGWIFYNAHFVETVLDSQAQGEDVEGEVTLSSNILSESSTQLPELLYYLVPVALITAAGYVLARRVSPPSTGEAITAGGTLILGYAPLALIGSFAFETSGAVEFFGGELSAAASPNLVMGVLLAGLVIPLLFGAIGATFGMDSEKR